MNKKILDENIWLYSFDAQEGKHFPFNIVALIDADEVLLIDAGFEHHAREYLADLASAGKRVVKAVVSHFHPDHIYGLREMEGVTVVGSERYEESFVVKLRDRERFVPDVLISSETQLTFGGFELRLIPMPGHDNTTLWVEINGKWLMVADDLITSASGQAILPSVPYKHVGRQIGALEQLKGLAHLKVIPAHGVLFEEKDKLVDEVDDRLLYLNNIKAAGKLIPYEEAVKGCRSDFLHKEVHRLMHRWK